MWWAETLEWFGDPNAPHFGHASAALVWMALAVLWGRTSDSGEATDE